MNLRFRLLGFWLGFNFKTIFQIEITNRNSRNIIHRIPSLAIQYSPTELYENNFFVNFSNKFQLNGIQFDWTHIYCSWRYIMLSATTQVSVIIFTFILFFILENTIFRYRYTLLLYNQKCTRESEFSNKYIYVCMCALNLHRTTLTHFGPVYWYVILYF